MELTIHNFNLCPTHSQFILFARSLLSSSGYTELSDFAEKQITSKKFYIIHDDDSILVFNIGTLENGVFLCSNYPDTHLKLRKSSYNSPDNIICCDSAPGMNIRSWLNRELKLAGKVLCKTSNGKEVKSYCSTVPVSFIPYGNTSEEISLQDLKPVFVAGNDGIASKDTVKSIVSQDLKIEMDDIIDMDLDLIDSREISRIGQELIAGQSIDGTCSSICTLESFLKSEEPTNGFKCLISFNGNIENIFSCILQKIGITAEILQKSILINIENYGTNCLEEGILIFRHSQDLVQSVFLHDVIDKYHIKAKDIRTLKQNKQLVEMPSIHIGIPIQNIGDIRELSLVNNIVFLEDAIKYSVNEWFSFGGCEF